MNVKSKYELEIVERVIAFRINQKKTQSYIAMILNVTEGYIGQVESPKYPSMYTLNQLNELARDFNCSPKDFHPLMPSNQVLPVRNYNSKKIGSQVQLALQKEIKAGFFSSGRYVKDIIDQLKTYDQFTDLPLSNAAVTSVLREFTSEGTLSSVKKGNKNLYAQKRSKPVS